MTDKEKIKEEIERRITTYNKGYANGDDRRADALELLLQFIDSLSEESASEDLEKEIDKEIDNLCELGCYMEDLAKGDSESVYPLPDNVVKELRKFALHFAEWQKEKLDKQFGFLKLKDCKDAYNEWKSTQDEPSAALAWIRACKWQKQQMMKNVVLETKVIMDCDGDGIETPYEEWLTLENTEIPYIPDNLGLKEGDKVKIIILKTE